MSSLQNRELSSFIFLTGKDFLPESWADRQVIAHDFPIDNRDRCTPITAPQPTGRSTSWATLGAIALLILSGLGLTIRANQIGNAFKAHASSTAIEIWRPR